jgi:WD40 repeat protein
METAPLRVYLSSTFQDLEEYRRAVFVGLDKAGLNVARMESYPAMDRRPLQQCLDDVARSDLYVGLFAWRYGYTPPAGQNPDGRSITELEYRHALATGIPTLLFCAHEDTQAGWPHRFVDDIAAESGRRLAALRAELAREKTIAFFRSPDELSTLVLASILRSDPAGRPYQVPLLPPGVVSRPGLVRVLLESLLGSGSAPGRSTVVQGAGGFGKTTLALDVCHRPELVSAFPDGVLWTTFGQRPDLPAKLGALYHAVTRRVATVAGIEALLDAVLKALNGRQCLLVLDDVWRPEHASMFAPLEATRLLVTTRLRTLREQARLGNWAEVSIGEMEPGEALALLAGDAVSDPQAAEPLKALSSRLGGWPILLDLVRARFLEEARERGIAEAVKYVATVLERRGVLSFDRTSDRREDAVARTVDVGLEFAEDGSPGLAERAAALSIFPEDTPIPIPVLGDLFDMDDLDVEQDVLRPLHNLNLVRWDRAASEVHLHDITRRALAARITEPAAVHARLLEAWGDPHTLPRQYAWRWFGWHTAHANRTARLRALLFDFGWLRAKLEATGVDALIQEFDHAAQPVSEPPRGARRRRPTPAWHEGLELQRLLGRASHILGRRPELLSQQIVARVTDSSPASRALVEAARTSAPASVMLPQTPSLASNGAVLRQVLQHAQGVCCIKPTGDGRLVSGGDDGSVYCTAIDGGKPILLARHEGQVQQLHLTGDGGVISGGNDGRVFFAGLTGGEPKLLLSGAGFIDQLLPISDGRILVGGSEGSYCVPLDGSPPVLLSSSYSLGIESLLPLGDERVLVRGGTFGHEVYCVRLDGGDRRQLLSDVWLLERVADGTLVYASLNAVFRASVDGDDVVELARVAGIKRLAVTIDGRYVVGCEDGRVFGGSIDGSEPPREIGRHPREVTKLVLTDDDRVISASFDGQILCAPLDASAAPVTMAWHKDGLTAIVFTGDGRVVTGGFAGDVICSSLDAGTPRKLAKHAGPIHALVLTGDGRVISGAWDGQVQCARLDGTGTALLATHSGEVRQVVLTGDSDVLTAGADGRIYCASLSQTPDPSAGGVRHTGGVTCMALRNDGQIVTGGWDGRVVSAPAGEIAGPLVSHDGPVHLLLVNDDGSVVTGGSDGRVCVAPRLGQPLILVRHAAEVTQLRLTRDGRVVSAGRDGFVYCARLNGGAVITLAHHKGNAMTRVGGVIALVLTQDGRVVTSGWDHCLYLSSVDGGEPRLIGRFDQVQISALEVTADGTLVVGGIGRVVCWPLAGGETITLEGPEGHIHSLALTGDGRVATYGSENRVCCGSLAGGRLVEIARPESGARRTILADGCVVLGCWDGSVLAVALDGSRRISLPSHEGPVVDLVSLGHGRVLSSGEDGTLIVADLASGEMAGIYAGDVTLRPVVLDVARSQVVAGDVNGRLHVLSIPR